MVNEDDELNCLEITSAPEQEDPQQTLEISGTRIMKHVGKPKNRNKYSSYQIDILFAKMCLKNTSRVAPRIAPFASAPSCRWDQFGSKKKLKVASFTLFPQRENRCWMPVPPLPGFGNRNLGCHTAIHLTPAPRGDEKPTAYSNVSA